MNVEIRDYDKSDFDAVNELLLHTFGYSKSDVSDPNVFEFVALLDNQVVGYFNLCRIIDIVRNICIMHVDYVCVSEEYRGKKIGRQMMDYAIEYAKNMGFSRLELTSGNHRIAAHRLYESLGFEKRDSSIFRKELL